MKKLTLFLILLCSSIFGSAQILKERRVYYLDCSFSMKENGIWNEVRDNLKNAIDNISDETTELIVIPFATNTSKSPVLYPISALATAKGKEMLKKKIDKLPMSNKTMTYHNIPLSDFYSNRVNKNRVTYMFLMTDGQDEDKPLYRAKKVLLPHWGKEFGDKNVFGFYVMLHKEAKDPTIDQVIANQKHLWKVETADVNINLVRLQPSAIFNAKNDKYIDLPIFGNSRGMTFNASFPNSCSYHVNKVEQIGEVLRVWIGCDNAKKTSMVSNNNMKIEMKGCGQYDFLVTENVIVKCENKPERTLKISVR